jgi:hypothetical protein
MSKEEIPVTVNHVERTGHILDAVVERRDKTGVYYPEITLQGTLLCTCKGSQMRDSKCVHLKAVLDSLDVAELRQFILDAQVFPI